MTHTSVEGGIALVFSKQRNHSKLSLFSTSTKAESKGIKWLLASFDIATSYVPLNFSVKKVLSMDTIGL
jgi:hypothetical protein